MEINLDEITSKVKSKADAIRLADSLGKININSQGYYLPDQKSFSCEFFYRFLCGKSSLLKS